MKKYELTDKTIACGAIILHQIKAVRDFGNIRKGDLGGWIEKDDNLSHDGNAWIYGNAWAHGNAKIQDNAEVSEDAKVSGEARIYEDAKVFGKAKISGNTEIHGTAKVFGNIWINGKTTICGDAEVSKNDDYIVFKNWWSSGRFFTWTKSNDKWACGCFYGTSKELIRKAYKDSKEIGREYEIITEYVDRIKRAGTEQNTRTTKNTLKRLLNLILRRENKPR